MGTNAFDPAALKKARVTAGLTQRSLAAKLGLHVISVRKWEQGICLPKADRLPQITAALGVSVNQLFGARNSELGDIDEALTALAIRTMSEGRFSDTADILQALDRIQTRRSEERRGAAGRYKRDKALAELARLDVENGLLEGSER